MLTCPAEMGEKAEFHPRSCYVRLPRVKLPVINRPDYEFKLGEAATLRDGTVSPETRSLRMLVRQPKG